jgi:hypothetical protein
VLAVADRQQGFSMRRGARICYPESSIYSLLAERGDRIVRDEDFAECYSERRGRPSIPPSLLAKVLLLAYREGLSDERAMEPSATGDCRLADTPDTRGPCLAAPGRGDGRLLAFAHGIPAPGASASSSAAVGLASPGSPAASGGGNWPGAQRPPVATAAGRPSIASRAGIARERCSPFPIADHEQVVRLAVGSASGLRSRTWRLWVPKRKRYVCVASRRHDHSVKVSLHEPGPVRFALTDEFI